MTNPIKPQTIKDNKKNTEMSTIKNTESEFIIMDHQNLIWLIKQFDTPESTKGHWWIYRWSDNLKSFISTKPIPAHVAEEVVKRYRYLELPATQQNLYRDLAKLPLIEQNKPRILEAELLDLLHGTIYDLNYPDVISWVVDNRKELLKLLMEFNGEQDEIALTRMAATEPIV